MDEIGLWLAHLSWEWIGLGLVGWLALLLLVAYGLHTRREKKRKDLPMTIRPDFPYAAKEQEP